ncbi:MAG: TRAP transporter small permease [Betaproteobacteria bacterium]
MRGLVAAADRILRGAAGLALALSGGAMFAQVIARYVFDAPFAWAEEFATLLFSWIIFLGAAAVQRTDSHLSVDTLRARAGPRGQAALDVFRRLVIIACSAVLLWQGVALSVKMWPLQYPAMDVTRSLLYLTTPVGAVFTILFAIWLLRTREPPGGGMAMDTARDGVSPVAPERR